MDVTEVPEWLGAAIAGAVLAVLSYVWTQIMQWLSEIRREERRRRARLTELLALIRAGDVAWKVQCENRNRLVEMIKARQPVLVQETRGFDHLLARAHSTMTAEERELYDVVRATKLPSM